MKIARTHTTKATSHRRSSLSQSALLRLGVVALLGACFIPSPSIIAQEDLTDFSSPSTGADGELKFPMNLPPLEGHSAAYHTGDGELVVFGGRNPSNNIYSNTTYTFDGFDWVVESPNTSPTLRAYGDMVYDAANGEIVYFGGYNTTDGNFAETWVWDDGDWTQKSPTNSPSARRDFSMAYDSVRGEVVLYGGASADSTYDSDTWIWDGSDWTEKASVESPSGRRYHRMAFFKEDESNGDVILFGGYRNGGWNNDTWSWNGTQWTLETPTNKPNSRYNHSMAFDEAGGRVVLFGGYYSPARNDTHVWDGTNWTEIATSNLPQARYSAEMAYDEGIDRVFLIGGIMSPATRSDTFKLENDDWASVTGDIFYFDMSEKPTGVWNYTTITIPAWVEVRFVKNAANTPVYWLASDQVVIDGVLRLDGQTAVNNNTPGSEAKGGPGGFDGGLGGTQFQVSDSHAGAPGSGPGGGNPGVTAARQDGQPGQFSGSYGSASLIPLIGGSGGGGGSSSVTVDGGNGAGGGGAILIASSRDINLNGTISARGGNHAWSGASYGGQGAGGAVRLVADRVSGTGRIDVRNGGNSQAAPTTGRVRIEGYYRTFIDDANYIYPAPTTGAPDDATGSILPDDQPSLIVTTVAGNAVPQPPAGSSATPDVVFQESGSITVVVTGVNVPDGTPINLRITTNGQVINLPGPGNPEVPLSGGTATFTVFVPAGLGNIQASAEFTPEP